MTAAVPSLGAAVCQVWWARPRAVDPALLDAATRRRVVALRRAADRERCATAAWATCSWPCTVGRGRGSSGPAAGRRG
ncbi:MAG: hypothetical protein R2736_16435 [Solirubrobacterales bacterium]